MGSGQLERDRQVYLRRKIGNDVARNACSHSHQKKTEGNKIKCLQCGRVVGFVKDPRSIQQEATRRGNENVYRDDGLDIQPNEEVEPLSESSQPNP